MKNEYKKPEAQVVSFETVEVMANPNAGFDWESNIDWGNQ